MGAAADMSSALPQLVDAYNKKTGQSVRLSFGSSGNLANQIKNGAPFDIFFSADEGYPKQLIDDGLALKESLYRPPNWATRALGSRHSPLDLPKLGVRALLDPTVQKISMANPKTAPYGRAAGRAAPTLGSTTRFPAGWW